MSEKPSFCMLDTAPLGRNLFWDAIKDSGHFGDISVAVQTDPMKVVEAAQGCLCIGLNKTVVTPLMARMLHRSGTRHYFVAATGTDNVAVRTINAMGGTVCNVPAYATIDVAEQTIGMIMDLARGLTANAKAVERGEWQEKGSFSFTRVKPRRVFGLTLGIIGLGRIGRNVAHLANGAQMKVMAHDPMVKHTRLDPLWLDLVDIDVLLKMSDIITIHTPGSSDGQPILGAKEFATIAEGGRCPDIINTSRGCNVNLGALEASLVAGSVRSAALDVFPEEPPCSTQYGHDLVTLLSLGCLITPHTAWLTEESVASLLETFIANINGIFDGNPQNLVT